MKGLILVLWGIWDVCYHYCRRLRYIQKEKNIFRYLIVKYNGETLRSNNGAMIKQGDLIVQLHIHNYILAKRCRYMNSEIQMGLVLRNEIKRSLPMLAEVLSNHAKEKQIAGIVGTTLLNKGGTQLGFSLAPVPKTAWFRFKSMYLRWLKYLMQPSSMRVRKSVNRSTKWKVFSKNGDQKKSGSLQRVFMTKQELYNMFLLRGNNTTS
ncbi:YkoP family protein [Brevibacillus daliensis]|uniref:YkoP family protein n=1 Tax=Brevibacillus daliensis TaxID=2892995 RepID=UPI001E3EC88C|nr:hypothetical protein [Brevibacillus daliensis]